MSSYLYDPEKPRPGRVSNPFQGHVADAIRKLGGLSTERIEPGQGEPSNTALNPTKITPATMALENLVKLGS